VLVVLVAEANTSTGTVAASAGGTPALRAGDNESLIAAGVYTVSHTSADLPSGGTITYTRATSGRAATIAAFCVQGTDGNAAVTTGGGVGQPGSSPATVAASASGLTAGQIAIGLACAKSNGGNTWTESSGYTDAFTKTTGNSTYAGLIAGYEVVSGTSASYNPTYTWSGSTQWVGLILAYNPGGVTASLAAGSFAETGETLMGIIALGAAYGSVAETGEVSTYGFTAALSTGTYTLTGEAATFSIITGTVMAAGFGSFAETGKTATFGEAGPLAVGIFAETGIAATFTITTGAFVVCAAGMFTETGEAATFVSGVSMFPFGRYALTGEAAGFAIGTIWAVQPPPSTVWTNEVG
jgi:hypothetical protein